MTLNLNDNFSHRFFYVAFYFLSWGLILFNNGIYWDDWTVLSVPGEVILCQHVQNGYVLNAYLMRLIFAFTQSVLLFRVYIFVLYLCTVFFLDSILATIKQIEDLDRFFIVLIFAVLPFNFARISVNLTFLFNTSFLFFMIAFWVLTKYFQTRSVSLRIVTLLFFLMSFFTPSLIFFYATTLLYIVYIERTKINNVVSFLRLGLKYADFVLIPVLFSVLRSLYFSPRGLYTGYNVISLSGVLKAPFLSVVNAKIFFYELMKILSNTFVNDGIELMIVSFVLFLLYSFGSELFSKERSKRDIIFFLVGTFVFVLGLFPYSVVNKPPYFGDWTGRYQLLLGIPTSIILYYGIKTFLLYLGINGRVIVFLLLLLIVTSVHTNLFVQLEYHKDTFKEEAIMQKFRQSDILRNNTSFYIVDDAQELNAMKRTYRFYEYAGMFKKIYGDETRFASQDTSDWNEYPLIMRYAECGIFSMRDYKIVPAQYKVTISHGGYNLSSTINTLKLLMYRFIDHSKYEAYLNNVINIDYEKI